MDFGEYSKSASHDKNDKTETEHKQQDDPDFLNDNKVESQPYPSRNMEVRNILNSASITKLNWG